MFGSGCLRNESGWLYIYTYNKICRIIKPERSWHLLPEGGGWAVAATRRLTRSRSLVTVYVRTTMTSLLYIIIIIIIVYTCRNRTNERRQLYRARRVLCGNWPGGCRSTVQMKLLFSLEKYIFNIIHICIIHVYYITNNIKPCNATGCGHIILYTYCLSFFSFSLTPPPTLSLSLPLSLSLYLYLSPSLSFVSITFEVVRLEICQSVQYYIWYAAVCANGRSQRERGCSREVYRCRGGESSVNRKDRYKTRNVSRAANKGLILLLSIYYYIT